MFGHIWNLRKALKNFEIESIEERLFKLLDEIKALNSVRSLTYQEFIRAIQLHHRQAYEEKILTDDDETLAIGGNMDKIGTIMLDEFKDIIQEFGLTLDIGRLIAEIDEDKNGTVDFDEFRMLLNDVRDEYEVDKNLSEPIPTSIPMENIYSFNI
jgi:Ca2+-binding EF-hand superfamily protein